MDIAAVDVDCPRCHQPVACSVEATPRAPKPGRKADTATLDLDLRVVDLADRFAEHYQAAGHTTPANTANTATP